MDHYSLRIIIGIVLLVIGFIPYAILFSDVNLTVGLEQFRFYERAVFVLFVEFLFRLVSIVLILGGMFMLFMGWYYRKETKKQPVWNLAGNRKIIKVQKKLGKTL